jgi:hypothetical protein
VRTQRPAQAFARGPRGGIVTTSIPPGSATLNAPVNCPARSRDQEPEPAATLPQIHQQIPCLPDGPRPVRVPGYARDMTMAGAHLDHEEHAAAAPGSGRQVTAQSTGKKSPASMAGACVRRNRRRVHLARRGAGGIRNRFSTHRTAAALTRMPRPRSSPRTRR